MLARNVKFRTEFDREIKKEETIDHEREARIIGSICITRDKYASDDVRLLTVNFSITQNIIFSSINSILPNLITN